MTRDENGARLVNLVRTVREPDKQIVGAIGISILAPGDIYQAVAEFVKGQVAALPEDDPLRVILHKIDRSLVKRPVMSYSYSVTQYGMALQIEDEMEDDDGPLKNLADEVDGALEEIDVRLDRKQYHRLAELIEKAVQKLLPMGEEVRDFLCKIARALASKGQILRWRTPSGLPFVNRYLIPDVYQVDVLLNDKSDRRSFADGHEPAIKREKPQTRLLPISFMHWTPRI